MHGQAKAQLFGAAKRIYNLNNMSLIYTALVALFLYFLDWSWVVDLVGFSDDEVNSLSGHVDVDYKNSLGFSMFWGWPARLFMIFSIFYGLRQGYKYKDELSRWHHNLKCTFMNLYLFLIGVLALVVLFLTGKMMSLDTAEFSGGNLYLYFWGYLYGSWVFSWFFYNSAFYFCSGVFKSKVN